MAAAGWIPVYSRWRHGGWYVDNLQYPSGAVGCVSNNYPDHKWRIACDDRPEAHERYTFPTRDAAAYAEYELVQTLKIRALVEKLAGTGYDPGYQAIADLIDEARALTSQQQKGSRS